MIDTLVAYESEIKASDVLNEYGLSEGEFVLLTFHRPANVNSPNNQLRLIKVIKNLAEFRKCLFPFHPRSQMAMENSEIWNHLSVIKTLFITHPLRYFQFQKLVKNVFVGITDIRGIQEETTFRQVHCINLRPNTKHLITIEVGSNILLSFDTIEIMRRSHLIEFGSVVRSLIPPLWDRSSTERILKVIKDL